MTVPLQVAEISKSFARKSVLTNISLAVPGGSLVGIVGENGVGKSTLLKIIVGAIRPDSGSVTRAGSAGYCPQEPELFEELTVLENFMLYAAAHGLPRDVWRKRADDLLGKLSFRQYEHSMVKTLSGGTRQKLNLAIALLQDPDVLVLDEPYAAFDWQTYLKFWELAEELRGIGKSLLIVSHLVYDKQKFDQIYELRSGSVERTQ
jgi:ABC-type multidrug transport system ATPase subunit